MEEWKKIHPQPKASKTSNFFKNAIMLEGIGTCHKLKYTTDVLLIFQDMASVCVCEYLCAHVCMDF